MLNASQIVVRLISRAIEYCVVLYADIQITRAIPSALRKKTVILFVGYDFRFAQGIIHFFESNENYQVIIQNEIKAAPINERVYRAYLSRADWVFVEWVLEYAAWYSRHKLPHQKLVIRGHRFEAYRQKALRFDWNKVDSFIAVSPFFEDVFQARYDIPSSIIHYVPNTIECERFDLLKNSEASKTIGMIGASRKIKRLDLALDLIENLYQIDESYRLLIKGQLGTEFNRAIDPDTLYFLECYSRIENAPWRENVTFIEQGDDVDAFLQHCGWILSVSDNEAFHVAVAEGMASGCIPLIIDWGGAHQIYPTSNIYSSVDEMVSRVLMGWNEAESEAAKRFIKEKYDAPLVYEQIEKLFLSN